MYLSGPNHPKRAASGRSGPGAGPTGGSQTPELDVHPRFWSPRTMKATRSASLGPQQRPLTGNRLKSNFLSGVPSCLGCWFCRSSRKPWANRPDGLVNRVRVAVARRGAIRVGSGQKSAEAIVVGRQAKLVRHPNAERRGQTDRPSRTAGRRRAEHLNREEPRRSRRRTSKRGIGNRRQALRTSLE